MSPSMDIAHDQKSPPREEEDVDMNDADAEAGYIDPYAEDSSSSYAPSIASVSASKRKRAPQDARIPANLDHRLVLDEAAGEDAEGEEGQEEDYAPAENRRKRAKLPYNDQYRELLNTVIQDACSYSLLDPDQARASLPASQLGATFWTSEEKETFFNTLARVGRDNTRAIAAAIRTKSEIEVRAYMQLLHSAFLEIYEYDNKDRWLGLTDFPAAYEISEECCAALETAGDTVSSHQEQAEARLETQRWPAVPLLTQDMAQWLDRRWEEGDEGRQEVYSTLPAATLLRPSAWLNLSEKIFMNPGEPNEEDNWHYLVDNNHETPSIQTTAFSDFHNLVVILTQRLVQAVLFQAMSRLRAKLRWKEFRQPGVNRSDVISALKLLGMKSDSKSFWAKAARRNHLQVYKHVSNTAASKSNPQTKAMTYSEVEAALGQSCDTNNDDDDDDDDEDLHLVADVEAGSDAGSDAGANAEEDLSDSSDLPGPNPHGFKADPDTSALDAHDPFNAINNDDPGFDTEAPLPHSRQRQVELNRLRLEQQQDDYADAIDRRASLLEESRLWGSLGRPHQPQLQPRPRPRRLRSQHSSPSSEEPPIPIKSEEDEGDLPEDIKLPMPPMRTMKRPEELVDWRDRIEYFSPWEVFDTPVPDEEFDHTARHRGSIRPFKTQGSGEYRATRATRGDKGKGTVKGDFDLAPDDDDDDDNGNGNGNGLPDEVEGDENKENIEDDGEESDNEDNPKDDVDSLDANMDNEP